MKNFKSRHFINKATKKKCGKRNTPEYDFHCQVADTLDRVLDPHLTCWSSIENSNHTGGVYGMIKQAKDKRKGVKSGVPDLFILYNGKSLWLELKAGKNGTSEAQDLFHNKIINAGGHVKVIRTIEQLLYTLKLYEVPLLVGIDQIL